MKFAVVRLLLNAADPATGQRPSASDVLLGAVREAQFFEEAGFDGYGIGEHHIDHAEASSPPVILGYLAAATERIRLLTGVTVLSLLDPVRVAEDYATLDVLSGGRVDVIIGKGNTEEQSRVFGYTNADQWERNQEGYELLRRLLDEENVSWSGRYRPPLTDFTSRPRPLTRFRIWHGSATSTASTDLAAKWGDPLFSANVSGPLAQYRGLVEDYRARWAAYGRNPADALVAAGAAATHVHESSQRAIEEYRPYFERAQANARLLGAPRVFDSLEDAIARGSYFVGSPQQVVEHVLRYHEALGHELQHVGDIGSPDDPVRRAGIERFVTEVAPALRSAVPDRLWDTPPAADPTPSPARSAVNGGPPAASLPAVIRTVPDAPTADSRYASPVDTATFGAYRIPPTAPGDDRPLLRFRGRVAADGSSGYAAESRRYHLYAGWFCPWSQRSLIALDLAGLADHVSVSYVDDERDGRGWAFRPYRGPDPVNGFALLREAFEASDPGFDGHVSVPVLWDRVTGRIVSNEPRTIDEDLATQFGAVASPQVDLFPPDLRAAIDELDRWIEPALVAGAEAAAGAGPGAEQARTLLNATLAELDTRLATSPHLLGDHLTAADVRLFVTLVRFDAGPNATRAINPGLDTFPHLWAYARSLYRIPAFERTTDFASFPSPLTATPGWDLAPADPTLPTPA